MSIVLIIRLSLIALFMVALIRAISKKKEYGSIAEDKEKESIIWRLLGILIVLVFIFIAGFISVLAILLLAVLILKIKNWLFLILIIIAWIYVTSSNNKEKRKLEAIETKREAKNE